MSKVLVYLHSQLVGELEEVLQEKGRQFRFSYVPNYEGAPISLAMPISKSVYIFDTFPPFFDGLLPEGLQLAGLLRHMKLDSKDYMGQLLCVGKDLVGAVTVEESK
jgi:serine/threonine-protein kinase HipA